MWCLVVIDTTKVRLFKQITTEVTRHICKLSCYWYHKGKTFQANHNSFRLLQTKKGVVIDTTKVRLFKQITTFYKFLNILICCYWYHKGKTFQANHNYNNDFYNSLTVVIDTTKVRLFKQITTYRVLSVWWRGCYWYHKGKTFQANHNIKFLCLILSKVVIDTTKVRLFKQITTDKLLDGKGSWLLLIPQR